MNALLPSLVRTISATSVAGMTALPLERTKRGAWMTGRSAVPSIRNVRLSADTSTVEAITRVFRSSTVMKPYPVSPSLRLRDWSESASNSAVPSGHATGCGVLKPLSRRSCHSYSTVAAAPAPRPGRR